MHDHEWTEGNIIGSFHPYPQEYCRKCELLKGLEDKFPTCPYNAAIPPFQVHVPVVQQ